MVSGFGVQGVGGGGGLFWRRGGDDVSKQTPLNAEAETRYMASAVLWRFRV